MLFPYYNGEQNAIFMNDSLYQKSIQLFCVLILLLLVLLILRSLFHFEYVNDNFHLLLSLHSRPIVTITTMENVQGQNNVKQIQNFQCVSL